MVNLEEYFDEEDIERFLDRALAIDERPQTEEDLKRSIIKAFGTPRGKNIVATLTSPRNLSALFNRTRPDPQEALSSAEETATRIETLESRKGDIENTIAERAAEAFAEGRESPRPATTETRRIEEIESQIEAQRGELAEQLASIETSIRNDTRAQVRQIQAEIRRLRRFA